MHTMLYGKRAKERGRENLAKTVGVACQQRPPKTRNFQQQRQQFKR